MIENAVILCGGKGKRFGAENLGIQKCCVPIGNSTPIEKIIDKLLSIHIKNFYFLTGFDSERTEAIITKKINGLANIIFIKDKNTKCTGASIINAIDKLPDKFLYHHGNILLNDKIYNQIHLSPFKKTNLFITKYREDLTHPVVQVKNGLSIEQVKRYAPKPIKRDWYHSIGVSIIIKNDINRNIQFKNSLDITTEQLLKTSNSRIEFTLVGSTWLHIETQKDIDDYK